MAQIHTYHNYPNCQWAKCSIEKTQSDRLNNKQQPAIYCLQDTHLGQRTQID